MKTIEGACLSPRQAILIHGPGDAHQSDDGKRGVSLGTAEANTRQCFTLIITGNPKESSTRSSAVSRINVS